MSSWHSIFSTKEKPEFKIYQIKVDNNKVRYYFEPKKEVIKIQRLSKSNIEAEYAALKVDSITDVKTLFETDTEIVVSIYVGADVEVSAVRPGVYELRSGMSGGPSLEEMDPIVEDDYVDLCGTLAEVVNEVDTFFTREAEYKSNGLAFRRSLLMYGPPGNSKTCTIKQVIKKYKDTHLIVYLPSKISQSSLAPIKQLTNLKKIFILEEITENAEIDLGGLLKFMDGELSIGNSFTIATTNFPETLPGNIVDRPSRLDRLVHIDNPNNEQRKIYLTHILKREISVEEIEATKGFSIAYLKELATRSIFDKIEFTQLVKEVAKRQALVKKSFAKTKPIGISRSLFDDDDY